MSVAMGQKPKIRVAAYARVSTDHEEQESSYEAQVDHFTKLIASHDDWTMVDIYADPGLSGKNTKRVQFKRMIKYYIWVCKRHENNGAEYCKSRPIKEEALEEAFVRALNELIGDKERILEKLQSATVSEITDSCATAINEVNAEIEKLQEQMMELLMKRNNGEITDKEYEQQSQQVGMKIDQLLMRKEEILSEQGKVQLASYRIEEVTKLLQTGKILEEFDRVMFKSLVRKITVLSNKEIEIEFECGITVRETL